MRNVVDVALLASHLLAMNVAAAGPLVGAWLLTYVGVQRAALARRIIWWSLAGLALGAALGALLLFVPSAELQAALRRFPAATYWYAGAELAFSTLCIAGMIILQCPKRRSPWVTWALALATASNLLYHFPPLMAVIGKLAADPQWATDASIERPVLLHLAARPEVLALWVHFSLASIATAAIVAMWPLAQNQEESAPANDAEIGAVRELGAIALGASLLQLPVGVWLLMAASSATRAALLGRSMASSAFFLVGVVTAVALLQALAAVALGDASPKLRRRTAGLLALVATLMTATLLTSRSAATHESAPTSSPPTHAARTAEAER